MTETLNPDAFQEPVTPGVVGDYVVETQEYVVGKAPTTAAWTRVRGIQELNPPKITKSLEDDSEINGDPYGSQVATGLDWEAELKIKLAAEGLTPDAGYTILETAGDGVGVEGMVWLRVYRANGASTGRQGLANVEFEEAGGKRTDLTSADVKFTGRGRLNRITVGSDGSSTIVS